jgi:phospholipase C
MRQLRKKSIAAVALATVDIGQLGTARTYASRDARDGRIDADESGRIRTATPIKRVIVIIGENRTFDNVYGTYVPKHGQHVRRGR